MKVAFYSCKPFEKVFFEQANQQYNFEISYFSFSLNADTAHSCQGYDAICVFVCDQLDEACISALKKQNIKIIAARSAGFNHININACKQQNISVVNVPEYSPSAIAEHTMALLLTLNRKTHKAYNRIRESNFSLDGLMGFNLENRTIGIIGLGKIGKRFAQICQGFNMHVKAYDPKPDHHFAHENKIEMVDDINTLYHASDIVSLHCPLTVDNRHMIDNNAIQQMKDKVVILNTGRGGLIDSKALIHGLKSQKIGAVALDVYEQEGDVFFEDHSRDIIEDDILMRLTTFPNVLITSHQGFFTEEALKQIANVTLKNLDEFEKSATCTNEVR